MPTIHPAAISQDGPYLASGCVQSISRAPFTRMLVRTRGEESIIRAVTVRTKAGRELIADKITGTIYDPTTGRCLSSDARELAGPVPEGYVTKPRVSAFDFGKQVVSTTPKKAPAARNAAGKVCGADKHSAKLNEEAVRLIRQKKPGSRDCYVMTNRQLQLQFSVSKSCIDDIRRYLTWTHVS